MPSDALRQAEPGDKVRCRYCGGWLVLAPWKLLDDGWQVYHWVSVTTQEVRCAGKKRKGKMNTLGEPEHRPLDSRIDMKVSGRVSS